MKIKEITAYLESLAPLSSQADFDNCGLLAGNENEDVQKALIALDCTEEIVEEAIQNKCRLIIVHHPVIFKGLKKLNGKNYVERTIIKALKNDIAIYAIHTNLDHYRFGVNHEIGKQLGLRNLKVLDPATDTLNKLVVYVPVSHFEEVSRAIFSAGGGYIGDYSECGFSVEGEGTFKPNEGTNPFEGKQGLRSEVKEKKLEVLVTKHQLRRVLTVMVDAHPYEEVAYDVIPLLNKNAYEGSGMYGELETEMEEREFLQLLKERFHCGCIRHTKLLGKKIKNVAFCGGAGSFLLSKAKQVKADIYVTGDFKYHEFFDAENEIVIADIGHFESEQFTINLIADILKKKFPTFAVHLTEVNTNPINYF